MSYPSYTAHGHVMKKEDAEAITTAAGTPLKSNFQDKLQLI